MDRNEGYFATCTQIVDNMGMPLTAFPSTTRRRPCHVPVESMLTPIVLAIAYIGSRLFQPGLLLLDAKQQLSPLCDDDGIKGGGWDVDPENRRGGERQSLAMMGNGKPFQQ